MSIKDIADKCKSVVRALERKDIFTVLLIVLVSSASFGLGRLSGLEEKRTPIRIEQSAAAISAVAQKEGMAPEAKKGTAGLSESLSGASAVQAGSFVASKNGTTYHFPWCSGALRIKDENKIWFDTKEAAERAGYHPAGNCKGL
ncbi:MAG: hypothetical protein HZC04_00975 [Candidatus Lloydbacteria bacterium]|nr:hypothetical protein [Candidatus Lloydbacteria bacterium]